MESSMQIAISGFNLKHSKSKPKIYKDKFGHICACSDGPIRIQRAGGRRAGADSFGGIVDAINFQHEVKEHLHASGFAVDRFLISSQGLPYFSSDDGETYTASKVITGRNANYAEKDDLLDVVAFIAKAHKALASASIATKFKTTKKYVTADDAAKLMDTLTALRKKLLKAGKFSDFDMLFLRGYDELSPHIAVSDNCDKNHDHTNSICHNLLKEENIFMLDNEVCITNFAEAAYAHHLHDLAYIIKRQIKAKPPEITSIDRVLAVYEHNFGAAVDAALFSHILLYPEKFIKLTMDYYSKKRSFAPNTFLTRMQECLRAGQILGLACGRL